MTARLFPRLRRDRRGAALVEFAIVSPVMVLMMMGLGDLLYQMYAQSVLNGAVQKAGRDSGIEGGAANSTTIDGQVESTVRKVVGNATFTESRKSYDTFSQVAPEPFVDTNGNNIRDPGECYTNVNGNSTWDVDPGRTGQGGASAVTLYSVSASFPHIFPVSKLFGWPATQTITATTLLKNQPYATQTTITSTTVCT